MVDLNNFEEEDMEESLDDFPTDDELSIPDRKPDILFTMGDLVGKASCGCIMEITDEDGDFGSSGFVWLCDKHRR